MGAEPGRRLLTACLLLGVLPVAFGAPAASAASQATSSPSWSVVPTPSPDAGSGSFNSLAAVSCVSAKFCMAVGSKSLPGSAPTVQLFEQWNGVHWSVVGGPPSLDGGVLDAVSCASDDFCMAVGNVHQTSTFTVEWDGTEWSVVPSPNPPSSVIGLNLTSVSCTDSDACVAVGFVHAGPQFTTHVLRFAGASWSTVSSPNPGPYSVLSSVSCSDHDGAICVAVGQYGQAEAGTGHAFIEDEHGGGWSVAANIDKIANANSYFSAVSCSSADWCAAIGTYQLGGVSYLLDDNWNRHSWQTVTTPPGDPQGIAISCLSATNCDELGTSGWVWSWGGSSWSKLSSQQLKGTFFAIDCADTFCAAVGNHEEHGTVLTYAEQRRSDDRHARAPITRSTEGGRAAPTVTYAQASKYGFNDATTIASDGPICGSRTPRATP